MLCELFSFYMNGDTFVITHSERQALETPAEPNKHHSTGCHLLFEMKLFRKTPAFNLEDNKNDAVIKRKVERKQRGVGIFQFKSLLMQNSKRV